MVKIFWIGSLEFNLYKICITSKLDKLILLLTNESERLSTELSGRFLYLSLHFKSKFTKKALSSGLEFLYTKLVENRRTQQG